MPDGAAPARFPQPIRLHIGGREKKPGWVNMDILPNPGIVDVLGSCTDLSAFVDSTVTEVYASHVFEHLDHVSELSRAIVEARRVLRPGGLLYVAVPDLEVLARLLLRPRLGVAERWELIRMFYGAQTDSADYHKMGFTFDILKQFLEQDGFTNTRRVGSFGLFDDTSDFAFLGERISLNVIAMKP